MRRISIILCVCLGALAAVPSISAKDKPGKKKNRAPEVASAGPATLGQAVQVKWAFSDEERQVMRTYMQGYAENGKAAKQLPPGLSKKVARGGKLPPGWQRTCVVGEILPADVYDQCHALPPDLVVKLPPGPEPTLTVTIGGKVVRLLKATREVLDVFDVNIGF